MAQWSRSPHRPGVPMPGRCGWARVTWPGWSCWGTCTGHPMTCSPPTWACGRIGLPLLGDALPRLPDRIKQQLFEAFDLAMLYHKTDNQVTCRATITPSTPAALAAIIGAAGIEDLAAYLADHAPSGDLSRHPGWAKTP